MADFWIIDRQGGEYTVTICENTEPVVEESFPSMFEALAFIKRSYQDDAR